MKRHKSTARRTARRKLTPRQAALFASHSRHHTKRHLAVMKRMMLAGKSFAQAHAGAMRSVGR